MKTLKLILVILQVIVFVATVGKLIYDHFNSILLYFLAYPIIVLLSIFALILIILAVCIFEINFARKIKLKNSFDVSKPVNKLNPKNDKLGITEYRDFYIERESDKEIENLLKEREYVFITGIPMLGKTRMAFEAIKKLKGYYLLKPKYGELDIQKLKLPFFKKKIVLFLDDLDKYAGKNLDDLIRELKERTQDFIVIATCRSGMEFDQIFAKKEMEDLLTQCQKAKIEPRKLKRNEESQLAVLVKKRLEQIASDGTPGSITIDLRYMKERYENLGDEKSILKSLKLLGQSNIFLWKENLVKEVSRLVFDLNVETAKWGGYTKSLLNNEFIKKSTNKIFISPDVYLDDRFLDDYSIEDDDLKSLVKILYDQLKDSENLFYLGNAFYYRNNWTQAEDCYRKSSDINPTFALAYAGLADVCVTKYDTYFERKVAVLDEAEKASQNALSIDPDLPEAHRALGRVYQYQKKPEKAIEEFEKAIKLRPNFCEAYRSLGWAYEKLGNFVEATDSARKALEIRPTDKETLRLLGIINYDQGLYKQALGFFYKAVDVAPNYGIAFHDIGSTFLKLGEFDRALEWFKKCIDAGGDRTTYLDSGYVYLLKKDYQKSLEFLQKSIKVEDFEFIAFYLLGLVYQQTNNDQKTQECYQKTVQLCCDRLKNDPGNPYLHSTLGLAYQALGEVEKAENAMNASLKLEPENGAIVYDQARFYALKRNEQKAIEFLKQALKLPLGPSKFEVRLDPHFKNLQKSPSFVEMTET
jgi:tetratricopeptide (TPR) repeat protein